MYNNNEIEVVSLRANGLHERGWREEWKGRKCNFNVEKV